jgi:hypothetical protein
MPQRHGVAAAVAASARRIRCRHNYSAKLRGLLLSGNHMSATAGNSKQKFPFRNGNRAGSSKAPYSLLICRLREPARGAWNKNRENPMIRKLTFAAALLAATVAQLVRRTLRRSSIARKVRRKASTPGLYTAGTPSTPRAHRLQPPARVQEGHHRGRAGPGRELRGLRRRPEYTFKLRQGVKFQTTDFFTPTRDFNADDVMFSFDRQLKEDNPWNKYVEGASWEYFAGMGMPGADQVDREGRRPHRQASR